MADDIMDAEDLEDVERKKDDDVEAHTLDDVADVEDLEDAE